MIIYYIIAFVSALIYAYYVLYFLDGIRKLKRTAPVLDNSKLPFLTVLISARNEEENIETTIRSIANQDYPENLFEIIAINDRSDDKTGEILENLRNEIDNLHVLHIASLPVKMPPKKHALYLGTKIAKAEYIVTTDADCTHHKHWLRSYACNVCTDMGVCAGMSYFAKDDYRSSFEKLWQTMQAIDAASQTLLSAGAIGKQMGFSANGSNMMFKKEIYQKFGVDCMKQKFTSGDDYFLIQTAAEKGYGLAFLTNEESVVISRPIDTLRQLFEQRARWGSKSPSSTKTVLPFLYSTALFYVSLILYPFSLLWGGFNIYIFIMLLGVKIIPETIFLSYSYGKFNLNFKPIHFLFLQLFHAPFNIAAGIKGVFFGFKWKGTKFRK